MRKKFETFSLLEVALPLLLFTTKSLFWAALLIPIVAGLTFVVFELLRRQSRTALSAAYMLWLVLCGGLGWFLAGIPPYWIWCVHLLVPETVSAPTVAQQAKPFLFGLRKYFKRRVTELGLAAILFLAFAGGVTLLHQKVSHVSYWVVALFLILFAEIVLFALQRRKK